MNTPLATYYHAYAFIELHEDYLQIHQSTGAIPYPAVLKNDGVTYNFNDVKEVHFQTELRRVGDSDDLEMTYRCTIVTSDSHPLVINSLIHPREGYQENQVEAYSNFMAVLLPKLRPSHPTLYGISGLNRRLHTISPKLLIAGKAVGGISLLSLLIVLIENLIWDFTNDFPSVIIFIVLISTVMFTFQYIFSKKRKSITWAEATQHYLPIAFTESVE